MSLTCHFGCRQENPTQIEEPEANNEPQSAIPSGFFDNSEQDAKARGIDLEVPPGS